MMSLFCLPKDPTVSRLIKIRTTLSGTKSARLGQCPREYIHDFVLIRQIPLGLIYGQQGINSLKFPFHALHFVKSTFFPYCPELPKRPKQKNSCSKWWIIDQLYIELGCYLKCSHLHLLYQDQDKDQKYFYFSL